MFCVRSTKKKMISVEIKDDIIEDFNDYSILTVPVLNGNESYSYFFDNHLRKNLPCLIKNVSSHWNCSNYWICGNKTNYNYFMKQYGRLEAPVTKCNEVTFDSHAKKNMKIQDYVQYLMGHEEDDLQYLKDWHLRKMCPDDKFYEVPLMFSSDWLNEYALDCNEDDFMFVYVGPPSSWTPVHVDVYSSYSWSVNITGMKKWILFPPGEEKKLKDSHGNLILNFIPKNNEDVKHFEVYQEKGDAIFVPSKWHHQVTNMLETISINHNWINGCNIKIVWESLQEHLKMVEKEISEFKDSPEYTSQCQLILKSLFGMDYEWFVTFLLYIAKKRLDQLRGKPYIHFEKYIFGKNHIRFDLQSVLKIFNFILEEPQFFEKCPILDLKNSINHVVKQITDSLK